jgi:hypothetical protein
MFTHHIHFVVVSLHLFECAAGADFKSVLINISSIAFFLLPFTLYFLYKKEEQDLPVSRTTAYYGIVATPLLLYCVAYFAPPVGWRKPHPYSDDARNVPYKFRAKSH